MREAYREFLFSNVAALGKLVSAELTAKLGGDTVSLDWEELRAGDIASHARAFGTLVQGGMDIERAAALSGLLRLNRGGYDSFLRASASRIPARKISCS